MKSDQHDKRLMTAMSKALGAMLEQFKRELQDELASKVDFVSAHSLRYHGVHQAGATHTFGDCVTHKGALWHCKVSKATATPGTDSSWQLMAKSAKDRSED